MKGRNILLIVFLVLVVAVILLTWGSIGSAMLTLGLLIGGLVTALRRSLRRQEEDYFGGEEA